MRRCPHCQAPNPEAALFCQHCGQAVPRVEHDAFWAWSDWFELATLRGIDTLRATLWAENYGSRRLLRSLGLAYRAEIHGGEMMITARLDA